jgi:hypothetical protein
MGVAVYLLTVTGLGSLCVWWALRRMGGSL